MEKLSPHILARLREGQRQRNLRLLIQYMAVVFGIILVYTATFQALMIYEDRDYSWVTGLYWTLTVMSTLGFGDITFHSDAGRVFTIVVLLSGMVSLFVMLPYTIIRYLYTPRAPTSVRPDVRDHVVLCRYDAFGPKLVDRLQQRGIPFLVVEPNDETAMALHEHGLPVVTGELDNAETWRGVNASQARLVVANCDDATNTSIVLTLREVATEVPLVATAGERAACDILELSGATHVLPLHERLGEHLASRVSAGSAHSHINGHYADLVIAEFPVLNTPLVGRTLRDTRLRERTGLSVVACWERGKLVPAGPDTVLAESSVPVVVGKQEQLDDLDAMFSIYFGNENPVIVIGGGRVGRAAARVLRQRGIGTHIIDRDASKLGELGALADRVFTGSGTDRRLLEEAGIHETPSVVISTADDANNIYLSAYCRHLNDDVRIISRITHDRNLEAIHRAGADYVLSSDAFAIKNLLAIIDRRELVLLGEDVDLFVVEAPQELIGRSLGKSQIGSRSGLSVIALRSATETITALSRDTRLRPGTELVMLGTPEQFEAFTGAFA